MTAAEMIRNYAEVRSRLMGRPAPRQAIVRALPPPPEPKPIAIGIPEFREPAKVVIPFKHKNRDWLDIASTIQPHSRLKTSNEIVFATAEKYRVSVAEIKGTRRDKFIVKARHECCYRLSKEMGYSLTQIGKILGDRDHTSVLSGIRRHEKRLLDPSIDDRPTRGR